MASANGPIRLISAAPGNFKRKTCRTPSFLLKRLWFWLGIEKKQKKNIYWWICHKLMIAWMIANLCSFFKWFLLFILKCAHTSLIPWSSRFITYFDSNVEACSKLRNQIDSFSWKWEYIARSTSSTFIQTHFGHTSLIRSNWCLNW